MPDRNRFEHSPATGNESENDLKPVTLASNLLNAPAFEGNAGDSPHTSSLSTILRRHATRTFIIEMPGSLELEILGTSVNKTSSNPVLIVTPTSHPTTPIFEGGGDDEFSQRPTIVGKHAARTSIVDINDGIDAEKSIAPVSGSNNEAVLISDPSSRPTTQDLQADAGSISPPQTLTIKNC